MSNRVRYYPDHLFLYARDKARPEELPGLLDLLDAYVAGIKETAKVSRVSIGDEPKIQELIRSSHETTHWIIETLSERGWKLNSDAKTWVAP
jgi:hypothetical protein